MPDFSSLEPWMWLVAGLALIGFEIIAPGLFLFWLGLAAGFTGLIAFLLVLSWQTELIIFAVAALVAVAIGRTLSKRRGNSDAPFLNERGNALIGQEFTLDHAITGGYGQVRIQDSVWRVSGPDLAKGTRIKIVGVDGSTLRIAKV